MASNLLHLFWVYTIIYEENFWQREVFFEQMCQLVAMWLGSSEKLIGLELSAGTTNLHVYPISLAWHVISGQKKTSLGFFFQKKGHLHFLLLLGLVVLSKLALLFDRVRGGSNVVSAYFYFTVGPKQKKDPPAIRIRKTIEYVFFWIFKAMRTLV